MLAGKDIVALIISIIIFSFFSIICCICINFLNILQIKIKAIIYLLNNIFLLLIILLTFFLLFEYMGSTYYNVILSGANYSFLTVGSLFLFGLILPIVSIVLGFNKSLLKLLFNKKDSNNSVNNVTNSDNEMKE